MSNLRLDYIDLYLVHWPVGFKLFDDATTNPLGSDGKILVK